MIIPTSIPLLKGDAMQPERIDLPGLRIERMPAGIWCEYERGGCVPVNEVCAAMFDEIVRLRSAAITSTLAVTPALTREGWKAVPVEPTELMIRNARENAVRQHGIAGVWRAMLAATPQPTTEKT